MPKSTTLPILGGLLVVGAIAGVSLGHSAISEIDPHHFAERPVRFHANRAPQRPDWAQVQVREYSGAGEFDGLGSGCFGCTARSVQFVTTHGGEAYVESWPEPRPSAAPPEQPERMWVEERPDPARERLVRYASYPVTQEEADAQAAVVDAPRAESPADIGGGVGID
jgi:hypothetical protein